MSSEAVEHFFTPQQEASIVEAIRLAEKSTSGEVRVHIEEGDLRVEVLRRAAEVFDALGMTATALHNGVLFYLDIRNHRLAIWGGQGIYEAVPHGFWDEEYRLIARAARRGKLAEGLCEAIEQVGEKLRTYFPYQTDDINELPDEISKGRIE